MSSGPGAVDGGLENTAGGDEETVGGRSGADSEDETAADAPNGDGFPDDKGWLSSGDETAVGGSDDDGSPGVDWLKVCIDLSLTVALGTFAQFGFRPLLTFGLGMSSGISILSITTSKSLTSDATVLFAGGSTSSSPVSDDVEPNDDFRFDLVVGPAQSWLAGVPARVVSPRSVTTSSSAGRPSINSCWSSSSSGSWMNDSSVAWNSLIAVAKTGSY